MKAIILVGGEGTRMRPLTLRTPKPLLPIANVPFIVRQIRWLRSFGITDVVLSLGYLPDAFEEYFKENPPEGVHLDYVVESEPLGTAGAIKFAAQDCDDNFVVCNGDVLTTIDLAQLMSRHENHDATATIALTHVDDPSAFGVVPTKDDGEVIAFVEKPPKETAPSHWINAGIYLLSPRFLDLIPEGMNVSVERETFPSVLEDNSMYAVESDSYWLDIGTPQQYVRAHTDYLEDFSRFGADDTLNEVAPNIFSDGEVTLGENVRASSRSLVGSGSVIEDNVILDGTTLGKRCIIESGVSLTSSVLASGVKIGMNTVLDSSLVGPSSDIGADSVLDDFTMVGAHEKIAAHSELHAERVGVVV